MAKHRAVSAAEAAESAAQRASVNPVVELRASSDDELQLWLDSFRPFVARNGKKSRLSYLPTDLLGDTPVSMDGLDCIFPDALSGSGASFSAIESSPSINKRASVGLGVAHARTASSMEPIAMPNGANLAGAALGDVAPHDGAAPAQADDMGGWHPADPFSMLSPPGMGVVSSSSAATSSDRALSITGVKSGYLWKRARKSGRNWKRRFFVLTEAEFRYFEDEHSTGKPKGVVRLDPLSSVTEGTARNDDGTANPDSFTVTCNGAELFLIAEKQSDMVAWCSALKVSPRFAMCKRLHVSA